MAFPRSTYYPHVNPRKEREGRIGEYRIAHGLTVHALASLLGVGDGHLANLESGMVAPINPRNGKVKDVVLKMCALFNCSPSDLFPRYICHLDKTDDVTFCQSVAACISAYSHNVADGGKIAELCDLVNKTLLTLPFNHQFVLRRLYKDSCTLEEIAEELGVTRQYVQALELEALRKLRHPSRSKGLR